MEKPDLLPCKNTDSDGKCVCKCPDGTLPKLENQVYNCLCKCADGRESNQLDDGTCNCTCTCPDESQLDRIISVFTKTQIVQYGCPCPCKCKNCQSSQKFYDKNNAVVKSVPNANDEGCMCPSDKINPDCQWVDCQVKCRKDPDPNRNGDNGDSHSSWGWGDVHYTTFDGLYYDFQGFGEYTYCKDEQNDFGIQIRNLWSSNKYGVSFTGGVAVKLRGSKLTVFLQKNLTYTIRFNGQIINSSSMPLQFGFDDITVNINSNGVSILRYYHSVVNIIFYSYYMSFSVNLFPNPFNLLSYTSNFKGLCGNADSNRFDDLQGPDGAFYISINDFAYSWKLNSSANSFANEWVYDKSNFHPDDVLDERFQTPSISRQTKLISNVNAEEICLKNNLRGNLLNACILDVAETGNVSIADVNTYKRDSCPTQCSFNGNCVGLDQCQCFDGWSGSDCSVSYCKNDCGTHGLCQNGLCKCNVGWQGDNCTTSVSCDLVNNCTDLNHGVCIGTNRCQCFYGYEGINCNSTISCASLSDCFGNIILNHY